MPRHKADIVIFGAGIAGLWSFHQLRKAGYNVLLLESHGIGGIQSMGSQGIIHSGLKYAFAGKVNQLARSISAMPDLWRSAFEGKGPVDLSAAKSAAHSQYLLIPPGLMGGLINLVTKKALGQNVQEVPPADWPENIRKTGFKGRVVYMDEPVIETHTVMRALAEPYKDAIRKIDWPGGVSLRTDQEGAITGVDIGGETIEADYYIFTAAGSNHDIARQLGHDKGLETQKRPLLMGMMKNAPYELYAHCVGPSEKPIATITTHKMHDGTLVWYLGGAVAERDKDAEPNEVFSAARQAFSKYLPQVDLSQVSWATWPVDRVEGKSATEGWMPDTPVIHKAANAFYCWPTKLTFAPLLANTLLQHLEEKGIVPSNHSGNWDFLPTAPYAEPPWENTEWIAENLARQAS